MKRKPDGRPGTGEPVPHVVVHRQDCFLTCQRLADDAREEARRRANGLSGPDTTGWKTVASAFHNPETAVIRKQPCEPARHSSPPFGFEGWL